MYLLACEGLVDLKKVEDIYKIYIPQKYTDGGARKDTVLIDIY